MDLAIVLFSLELLVYTIIIQYNSEYPDFLVRIATHGLRWTKVVKLMYTYKQEHFVFNTQPDIG